MRSKIVVGCLVLLGSAACTKSPSEEQELKAAVKEIPWMMQFMEVCSAYESAKQNADADRRDLARHSFNMLRNSKVERIKGLVEILSPIGEGDNFREYTLQIGVGSKIKFMSQSKHRPIERGTEIFAVAEQLEKDECVVFSAENFEASANFAQGKVCIPRFYAKFTHLEPCVDE